MKIDLKNQPWNASPNMQHDTVIPASRRDIRDMALFGDGEDTGLRWEPAEIIEQRTENGVTRGTFRISKTDLHCNEK